MLRLAATVWIWLGFIHHNPMVEVRYPVGYVMHEIHNSRVVSVVDVLWLIGDLMVIPVNAREEERDRNPEARIHVVVASAIHPVRLTWRIEDVRERKRSRLFSIDVIDDVTQLGAQLREPITSTKSGLP